MLRVPAPSDVFGDCPFSVVAKETVFSAHLLPVVSSQRTCCIGSGAFGTVRLAWLQERKTCCRRIFTAVGERMETTVLLGACAAVAVKRVTIPEASDGQGRSRRQLLLRELQVMERIRMHPHPNIVQCWGFLFGRKDREPTPNLWNSSSDSTGTSRDGALLTNLKNEIQLMTFSDDTNTGEELSVQQILEGASYVDLCLSLCTGGTLGDYVRHKARQTFHEATAGTYFSILELPVETGTMTFEKMSIDDISGNQGLTGSTSEGTSSFTCNDDCGATYTHPSNNFAGEKESAKANSNFLPASLEFPARLALPERDIVAIVYALANALHHTHGTLKTLHRDIKPSNVLIFSGVGKTPQYALQSSSVLSEASRGEASHGSGTTISNEAIPLSLSEDSKSSNMLSDSGDSVEFALFSECPATLQGSTTEALQYGSERKPVTPAPEAEVSNATDEPPATLVVPLGCGQYRLPYAAGESPRKTYIDYLPQVEGWRIQLADFGVATGVDQLAGSGRCGSPPFMAPEVVEHAHKGVSTMYDTKADIYSLGVTLQYMLLHLIVGCEAGARTPCSHTEALGAQWVDEEDTATQFHVADDPEPAVQPQFLVPSTWRCDRELVEGHYIRSASLETKPPTPDVDEGNREKSNGKAFAVPRAWRCRDELLERRYIRSGSSSSRGDSDIHLHLFTPLAEGPKAVRGAHTAKERRGSRCSSCGKLHRHLIELLNVMTRRKASQRPPLSTVLQSAAVIEQGTFLHAGKSFASYSSSPTAVGAVGVDGGNIISPTALDSSGMRRDAGGRLHRAHRRAQEKRCVRSPPTGFCLDMTPPQQKNNNQQKSCDGGECDTTVLLWRPPSLRFLRASHTKTRMRSE
ncbi:protein kinase [Trypanosoma rangeli SC58]|uniref:Protein kinase n=1 Tax=Trypanosoma rangeli SC58 TaxID=429131 RepID=A0A061J3B6_TRYRA|nr:protein kinase [Trypanosoma rangeli SC58]